MCSCCALVAGHQLHFDSDDEGQGGVRHPIITAIVYLSDNTSPAQRQPGCRDSHGAAGAGLGSGTVRSCCCGACGAGQAGSCVCVQQEWVGGPTLMTDQVLGGPLATQGWLAYPATNRVVFFDGRYLHGEGRFGGVAAGFSAAIGWRCARVEDVIKACVGLRVQVSSLGAVRPQVMGAAAR